MVTTKRSTPTKSGKRNLKKSTSHYMLAKARQKRRSQQQKKERMMRDVPSDVSRDIIEHRRRQQKAKSKATAKKRYYFHRVKGTKKGDLSRSTSRYFDTLAKAKIQAKKEWKAGKILQATFWDATNRWDQKRAGGLNTKGKFVSRKYA